MSCVVLCERGDKAAFLKEVAFKEGSVLLPTDVALTSLGRGDEAETVKWYPQ